MTRVPGNLPLWVDADSASGWIRVYIGNTQIPVMELDAIQLEGLIQVLSGADYVVKTGVGKV